MIVDDVRRERVVGLHEGCTIGERDMQCLAIQRDPGEETLDITSAQRLQRVRLKGFKHAGVLVVFVDRAGRT